jgi:FKBP-type peptidyl-prolyl cis-trans isomerase FkpA
MRKFLAIALLAITVASCNNSRYEKTASGLAYKIIKGNKSEKLKFGQFVKINGVVKRTPNDSVLFTTYGLMPEYLPVDTSSRKSHDFNEVLKLCSVGDSLIVIAQVDTIVKLGMGQYNEVLKKGGQIETRIKILQAFNSEQERAADQQKEVEKFKSNEVAELESYLKKNNIKANKTPNGVFVEVTNPGTGPKAQAGQQVTVHYTGSVLKTGKVFDSNVDTSFKHPQPFSFVIGSGQVIRGWDEGFQELSKGGKANLYIPSLLGYGPPGNGQAIPPYAALKFAVEVNDIGAAPAAQQQPQLSAEDIQRMMQQQQQQQQQQQGQQQQPGGKQ